jgi:hypothetical protein
MTMLARSSRHLLTVVCLASLLCIATPASAEPLRPMTGPQGGVWVPLGGSMKNLWE